MKHKEIEQKIYNIAVFAEHTDEDEVVWIARYLAQKHGISADGISYIRRSFDAVEHTELERVVFNVPEAWEVIKSAIRFGDAYALATLLFLRNYRLNLKTDYSFTDKGFITSTMFVLEMAAMNLEGDDREESALLAFCLARACFEGRGMERNLTRAAKFYKIAAKKGIPMAELFCFEAEGDRRGACDVARRLIDLYPNNHIIKYFVGYAYYFGVGVERDALRAYEILSFTYKVSQWGGDNSDKYFYGARYMLGLCYFFGYGTERNLNEAAALFRFSSTNDTPEALYCRAVANMLCSTGGASPWHIFGYLKESADLGYIPAIRKTAFCYLVGYGVELSEELADEYGRRYERALREYDGQYQPSDLGDELDFISVTLKNGEIAKDSLKREVGGSE